MEVAYSICAYVHVRLSVVPAYRVSVLLTIMDGVGTGTVEVACACDMLEHAEEYG